MYPSHPRLRRSALAALAVLLAAPIGALTASPANSAPSLDSAEVVGRPTVDESDFRGAPAGEEEVVDLALTYGSPRIEITRPGATYIKVHFTALRLVPGDHVTVSDPTGRETHTYSTDPTGDTAGAGDSSYTVHRTRGFAAMSVDGDTGDCQARHRTIDAAFCDAVRTRAAADTGPGNSFAPLSPSPFPRAGEGLYRSLHLAGARSG